MQREVRQNQNSSHSFYIHRIRTCTTNAVTLPRRSANAPLLGMNCVYAYDIEATRRNVILLDFPGTIVLSTIGVVLSTGVRERSTAGSTCYGSNVALFLYLAIEGERREARVLLSYQHYLSKLRFLLCSN